MSIFTTVIVKRATMQKYTHISVQLDDISATTVALSNGMIPENSSLLISQQGVPDIQTQDQLIDEGTSAWNLDSKTVSGKVEYRVSGKPQIYPYDHLEVVVTRFVGT